MPLKQDNVDGSWGPQSANWPYIQFMDYEDAKAAHYIAWHDCKVPYGSYVVVGCQLRLETEEYKQTVLAAWNTRHAQEGELFNAETIAQIAAVNPSAMPERMPVAPQDTTGTMGNSYADAPQDNAGAGEHNFRLLEYITDWLIARNALLTNSTEEADGPMAPAINIIESFQALSPAIGEREGLVRRLQADLLAVQEERDALRDELQARASTPPSGLEPAANFWHSYQSSEIGGEYGITLNGKLVHSDIAWSEEDAKTLAAALNQAIRAIGEK